MNTRSLWIAGTPRRCSGLMVLVVTLASCGGAAVGSPLQPPLPPPLDYRAVAGSWEGTLMELRTPLAYPVRITLSQSAPPGSPAGSIEYGAPAGCTGDLIADSVRDESEYAFKELIRGPCTTDGRVRLIHDRPVDTIGYTWYSRDGRQCCCARLTRRP